MFDIENQEVTFDFVVSNDTDAVQATEATMQDVGIEQTLEQMIAERLDWEANAYQASNRQLYQILAKCYAMDWQLDNEDFEGEQRAAVNAYAKLRGFKFKAGTAMITKIVRCVFGNVHRSRVSTYSVVLREAKRQQIAAADIPTFIEQAGGVQEIRTATSKARSTPKPKPEAAEVDSDPVQVTDDGEQGELCVVIARQLADGSFVMQAVVRDQALLDAALAVHNGKDILVAQADEAPPIAAVEQSDQQRRIALLQRIVNRH
jgi:hypothetical protein